MFSFLVMIGFFWLFVNGIGLALRLTWGAAKVVGSLLMALALPVLIVCVLYTNNFHNCYASALKGKNNSH